ncbi:MAG: hypothetical protein PHI97_30490 [Desulfobulbus sp.]|nr:hypothetical protein [Desulfobulbus sp.]
MNKLNQLKKELERTCKIYKWNPSTEQIANILREINELHSLDKSISLPEITGIVSSNCPDALFLVQEGVDNSDLNTLLAMAISATNTEK